MTNSEAAREELSVIFASIPTDTGLESEEMLLEVASKIMHGFKGPEKYQKILDDAVNALDEYGVYYGATVHPEDLESNDAGETMKIIVDVSNKFEPGAESIADFIEQVSHVFERMAKALKANPNKNVEDVINDATDPQHLLMVDGEY
jgi:hypothetical protein